jgi:hypothetical protein
MYNPEMILEMLRSTKMRVAASRALMRDRASVFEAPGLQSGGLSRRCTPVGCWWKIARIT